VRINGLLQSGAGAERTFNTKLTEPWKAKIVVKDGDAVFERTVTLEPGRDVSESFGNAVPSALDEVNAARAQRGLPPFQRDDGLTAGALSAAQYRAERLIAGHCPSDFAHLPPGANATAAGCAAWPPSLGWGACCTYEGYTYAGAAIVMGSDGRRYMHLFVR
jgi:hypothetical protein